MGDYTVLTVVGFVAAVAAVAALGLLFARKRDAGQAELIAEALAAVARAINETLGDAEVSALASWAYDRFGVSQYYSREDWVALCLRLVRRAEDSLPAAQRVVR